MIDPLYLNEKSIRLLCKNFGLQLLIGLDQKQYFFRKRLLKYGLNITPSFYKKLKKSKFNQNDVVITGFGLTGGLHLGNKLLLNEIGIFHNMGCKIIIFLSTSDGISKKLDVIKIQQFKSKITSYISKKFENKKNFKIINDVDLEFNVNSFRKILDRNDIFTEIFNELPSIEIKKALVSMALSIATIKKQNKGEIFVLLGIDEVYNTLFINKVFKMLNLPKPSFLFNRVLLGYDLKKMGKSRSNTSLLIENETDYEINKLEKNLLMRTESEKQFIFNEIATFSEYGDKYKNRNGIFSIKDIRGIITEEFNEFKINSG